MSDVDGLSKYDFEGHTKDNFNAWEAMATKWEEFQTEECEDGNDMFTQCLLPLVSELADLENLDTTTRVLDLGAGSGMVARRIAVQGAHVVGLDFSEEMLQYGRKRAAVEGPYTRLEEMALMDFEAMERFMRKEDKFDIVTLSTSLKSLLLLESVAKALPLMLKPDGRIVLVDRHPAFSKPAAHREMEVYEDSRTRGLDRVGRSSVAFRMARARTSWESLQHEDLNGSANGAASSSATTRVFVDEIPGQDFPGSMPGCLEHQWHPLWTWPENHSTSFLGRPLLRILEPSNWNRTIKAALWYGLAYLLSQLPLVDAADATSGTVVSWHKTFSRVSTISGAIMFGLALSYFVVRNLTPEGVTQKVRTGVFAGWLSSCAAFLPSTLANLQLLGPITLLLIGALVILAPCVVALAPDSAAASDAVLAFGTCAIFAVLLAVLLLQKSTNWLTLHIGSFATTLAGPCVSGAQA